MDNGNNLLVLSNSGSNGGNASLQKNDIEIFDGIKLTDFYKQSYQGHKTNQERISELITNLSALVRTTTDAIALVPLISSYLENNNKNDENLIKLVTLIQKHALFELENIIVPDVPIDTNSAGVQILSEAQKNELRKQLNAFKNINSGIDKAVDKAQQNIRENIQQNETIEDVESEEIN